MILKTLIADDEPLARERLRSLLCGEADVEIVDECRNGSEVVATLKERQVDLLFLDIQMPGKDGFDVFAHMGVMQMPVTVFVTAHQQHALQAFEVQALDYLTKPIEPKRLQATLVRVRDRVASNTALRTHEQLKSVLKNLEGNVEAQREYPKRLLVPENAKDTFVEVNEIQWIEAADYYCCLHVGKNNLMLRETVKQLANTLDPKKFVRIHRSIIVNVGEVKEIVRDGRSEGSVVLKSGQRLKMSKAGWQNLLTATRS